MTGKTLVLLQENSGRVPLPASTPPRLRRVVYAALDWVAEEFEGVKTLLQARRGYSGVLLLHGTRGTRAHLLQALVAEARRGRVVDLMVLGHGLPERLLLRGEALAGGPGGSLRALAADARTHRVARLPLRLVYMCNCYGATVADDWLVAGAAAAVGTRLDNYLPEPTTTFFLANWLAGMPAGEAARDAYARAVPWVAPFLPQRRIAESELVVAGDEELTF